MATTEDATALGSSVQSAYYSGTEPDEPYVWAMKTAGGDVIAGDPAGLQASELNDLSSAQVNAEVLDVLTVDTFAEPSSAPAAISSLKDKIGWAFKMLRNRLNQTATTATLFADDATTPDSTAAVSDDGSTTERGEWS